MESVPSSSTPNPPSTDVPPPPTSKEHQPPTSTTPAQLPTSAKQPTDQQEQPQTTQKPDSEQERRIAQTTAKIATLTDRIAEAEAERDGLLLKLKTPSIPASTIVKRHIDLLHTYNEIRDVGTALMGLIAEKRGVRVQTVYDEMGVAGRD